MIDVGKRIKELRERKGFTTNGLACSTGISQSYIREMETGKYNNPSIGVICEICQSLSIPVSEFFEDDDKDIKSQNEELTKMIDKLTSEQKKSLTEFLNTMINWGS